MPLVLLRIDERLIHGQVVLGWGSRLSPDRYLVVCDELAESEWEQDLYRLALEEGQEADFVTVEGGRARLEEWRSDPRRSILLTRDVRSMRELGRGGALQGEEVNVGGIHHAAGRHQVLPYVHLSEDEEADLLRIAEEGALVSARDLPETQRVPLKKLSG